MKNLLLMAVFSTLALQGCYTVLLTTDDNNVSNDEYYGYYPVEYYGDYENYYDFPWWISSPIVTISSTQPEKRDENTQSLRNNGWSRNENEKRDLIILTPPPSRDNSSDTSTKNSSTDSGNNLQSRSRNNPENNSNSSSSESVRNENGNRNSGNIRR